MHVLLTTDTLGGVWTYTKELTEGLIRSGCEVTLVSFGRLPSDTQSRWILHLEEVAPDRFRYLPSDIPLEWMPENGRVVELGTAFLKAAVRDFGPDLLHLNQFCFGQLSVDVPKLLVAHSDVLSWAESCIPGGLEASEWLSRYTDIVQSGLRGVNTLVAPTAYMMSALQNNFVLPASQKIIPNGRTVITDEFPHGRVLQAVTAGRMWDPSKNLALLGQIREVPVLIAGEITEETPVHACGANVRYVGFLSERELHSLFSRSHIYVAASIYEPFGLAPLEAALCGCALVANDIPSFHEVWGPAALYFKTAEGLEQLLRRLSSDSLLLREMQIRVFAQAQRYSTEKMTLGYLSLYQELHSSFRQRSLQTESSFFHV